MEIVTVRFREKCKDTYGALGYNYILSLPTAVDVGDDVVVETRFGPAVAKIFSIRSIDCMPVDELKTLKFVISKVDTTDVDRSKSAFYVYLDAYDKLSDMYAKKLAERAKQSFYDKMLEVIGEDAVELINKMKKVSEDLL